LRFRLLISLAVFIGSYLPLAAILMVQDVNYVALAHKACWPLHEQACTIPLRHPFLSIGLLLFTLSCFLVTAVALQVVRPKIPINIVNPRYIPAELINYTLPYIVAFMALGYDDVGKLLGLVLFMGWLFVIVNKSGQLILNPILVVFGWRLYELEYTFPGDPRARVSQALVKGHIEPGAQYNQASLQDVLVIRPG
jgi:hypothetical protein